MNLATNTIQIAKNAKRIALVDAIEALEHERARLEPINAEMAKGIGLAILFLRSQKDAIR